MAAYPTRIGELVFTHEFADGYPTDQTVARLYDERDFQRACQAYLWALPLVSFAQWQFSHRAQLGAANGECVYVESYRDKVGGLTYNMSTPYALPFIDLAEEGPYVIDIPVGEYRGAIHDAWQIEITRKPDPGKYLFVGPGQDVPAGAEDVVDGIFRSPTMNILAGLRVMSEDEGQRLSWLERLSLYPYAERANPRPRGYRRPDGTEWSATPPRGLTYWERLARALDREPVFERDRFFMAMLRPLGIEKGRAFEPDERQTKILTEAAFVGEAMAKANDFAKRMDNAHYVDGVQWEYATVCAPHQREEYHDQLDERAAWLYEAVTNDIAMHGQETGVGQVYMSTYKDADGAWLDGAENYVLRLPPDVPAEAFWSICLYDVDTRCLLRNDDEVHGSYGSSREDIDQNADGSIDIHIGPDRPAGGETNWLPTVPGRAWFPYFRIYSPKQAFLDKTWILPDIERAR